MCAAWVRPERLVATRPAPRRYADEGWWPESSLGAALDEAVKTVPEGLAVVDGPVRLDYRALADQVNRVAAGLGSLGVRAGDVVTVELPNWWEALVAMHAVLRIGAVVNPVVPIYRDRELEIHLAPSPAPGHDRAPPLPGVRLRRDAPAPVSGGLPPGRGRAGPRTTVTRRVSIVRRDCRPEDTAPDAHARPDDICLLLYTSGTTADPKGVLHNHRTLGYENGSIVELFGLGDSYTIFMPSPVTHITGFLYGLLMPAVLRVPSVLLDVWDPRQSPSELVEAETCRFSVRRDAVPAGPDRRRTRRRPRSHLSVRRSRRASRAGAPGPHRARRHGRARLRVVGVPDLLVRRPTRRPGTSPPRPTACPSARWNGRLDDVDGAGVGETGRRGPDLFLGYLDAPLNEDAFTDGWVLPHR